MTTTPNHRDTTDRPRDGQRHDVIIVGARASGASTALLLAKAGLDVLVVDRSAYGADTLSSHALMRGGVDHLRRWGLLDQVADVTPPIHRTVFEFGGHPVVVDEPEPLYAPRRTVLDPIIVDAAMEAGAEFCFGTRLVDLRQDRTGRVVGVEVETGDGRRVGLDADLVVGADGLRSRVARLVDAPVTRRGRNCLASIYSHVRDADLPSHDYRFAYGDGRVGGSIPTNDGLHCVFVSLAPELFHRGVQLDVSAALLTTLRRVSPELADGAQAGTIVGQFRSFPGHVGQFRSPAGNGWALVGDAGYFKDPAAAHGLSDAFRDAELLSTAIIDGDLDGYEQARDHLSMPLFEDIEDLTALDWDAEGAARILAAFARSMRAEAAALRDRRAAVA